MAYISDYDKAFETLAIAHFSDTGIDWRWFKAQGIAESSLNPLAVSSCGARGIMQIMPLTWDEIAGRLDLVDPFNAEESIRAGVYYMRRQWDWWWDRGVQAV